MNIYLYIDRCATQAIYAWYTYRYIDAQSYINIDIYNYSITILSPFNIYISFPICISCAMTTFHFLPGMGRNLVDENMGAWTAGKPPESWKDKPGSALDGYFRTGILGRIWT